MKKLYFSFLAVLCVLVGRSQDAAYYVGSGSDTAYLVIDFQDGTSDSSSVWGYLFDASMSVTGGDMLLDIAADEENLTVSAGSFLNDITFNSHVGIGGTNGFYWGTWSKSGVNAWASNSGISEVLANGDWFGCSFTDFSPAIEPGVAQKAYASKWFDKSKVDYWVGSGPDSSYLIVDFVDDVYGEAVTFVWGVKFTGNTTGEDMLNAVAAADANFGVLISGGFLSDITYGSYAGIGGSPSYWGTFSASNLSDWTMNAGISAIVADGGMFGVSYAAWPPRRPVTPVNAVNPDAVRFSDINEWIGTGTDSAVIVIDFNDGTADESMALGYLFSGITTAEDALNDLDAHYGAMDVTIGSGFLNDISFDTHAGIGGTNGFYWGTWSGTNGGNFEMNAGLSEQLSNGDWFGCAFTDFSPALPPSVSSPVQSTVSVTEFTEVTYSIYPNPTVGSISINIEGLQGGAYVISDLSGKVVMNGSLNNTTSISAEKLSAGFYNFTLITNNGLSTQKFQKL